VNRDAKGRASRSPRGEERKMRAVVGYEAGYEVAKPVNADALSRPQQIMTGCLPFGCLALE
jgi:hypothetical protein